MTEVNKDFWDVDIINTFDDCVLIQIPNGDTAVLTKEEYYILRKKINEKKGII